MYLYSLPDEALSSADLARIVHGFSCTAAFIACLDIHELSEGRVLFDLYLARAAANRAALCFLGFGSGPLARVTRHAFIDRNVFLCTKYRFFKRNL